MHCPARFVSALAWGALAAPTLPASIRAQAMPAPLAQFLEQTIALNQDEIRAASDGKPMVKALDSPDRREIAVFGIVRIDVPRSFYLQRASTFPSSLRRPSQLRFGLFSDPATASDVATLSLPHEDVQDLAHCRPGSCKVKLSSRAIAELRERLPPDSRAADSVASAYFRARMIAYITAYRARGDSALIVYEDQPAAAAAAQVFDELLSGSPYLYRYAPALERYLKNYPNDRPAEVSEALFWSEDDLPGLKPTLTMTHEVVYAPPELEGCTLIASKQLYADHYLDGALDVTAIVDRVAHQTDVPGIYVLLLRRLHFDDLPSGGLVNVRGKVISKLRDRSKTALEDVKTRLEQAYATASGLSR